MGDDLWSTTPMSFERLRCLWSRNHHSIQWRRLLCAIHLGKVNGAVNIREDLRASRYELYRRVSVGFQTTSPKFYIDRHFLALLRHWSQLFMHETQREADHWALGWNVRCSHRLFQIRYHLLAHWNPHALRACSKVQLALKALVHYDCFRLTTFRECVNQRSAHNDSSYALVTTVLAVTDALMKSFRA